MPRTCGICSHEKLDEINAALLRSDSLRKISENSGVSQTALHRHKADHLPVALMKAEEAKQIEAGGTLWEQLRSLHARSLAILARAENAGQLETALKAIRECRNNIELMMRIDGDLPERTPGSIDLTGLSHDDLEKLEVILERTSIKFRKQGGASAEFDQQLSDAGKKILDVSGSALE